MRGRDWGGPKPGLSRAALLVGLFAIGCSSDDGDRPPFYKPPGLKPPVERLPPRTGAFETARCSARIPIGFKHECGYLSVPEVRADAASATIRLAVAITYTNSPSPRPDPVIYLDGGPGSGPIDYLFSADVFEPILGERDLILLDQRGTGLSEPLLTCPELDRDGSSGALVRLSECRSRLESEGVVLSAYNTAENAADVEDLRIALGYPEWNVYGISYGTRLGLSVLRDHPAALRSLTIDGVLPLEANLFADQPRLGQRAFDLLFDACAAQASCAANFPNLRNEFFALVTALNQTPEVLRLSDGTQLALSGSLLVDLLFSILYSATVIPYLPSIIDQAFLGDFSFFQQVMEGVDNQSQLAFGMYLSVLCADEVPFSTPEEVAEAGRLVDPVFAEAFATDDIFEWCSAWSVAPSPAHENQPVTGSVASLVTSGQFDPITPPEYGALVAANLSASHEYTLADQSHGASIGDCGMELVTGFLDNPSGGFDDTCVGSLSDPAFKTLSRPSAARRIEFVAAGIRPPPALVDQIVQQLRRSPLDWLRRLRHR